MNPTWRMWAAQIAAIVRPSRARTSSASGGRSCTSRADAHHYLHDSLPADDQPRPRLRSRPGYAHLRHITSSFFCAW